MNIPPLIRTGPVPRPTPTDDGRYVVLTLQSGWCFVRWDRRFFNQHRTLVLIDCYKLEHINPDDVLCWMPADGS